MIESGYAFNYIYWWNQWITANANKPKYGCTHLLITENNKRGLNSTILCNINITHYNVRTATFNLHTQEI